MIQAIGNLKGYLSHVKEILLYLSTDIAFVPKHHAVAVFPLHILQITKIMYISSRQIEGVDDSAYSTDCMVFIAIIVDSLRSVIPH